MNLEGMIRTWKDGQFFLLAVVSTNPPPKLERGEIRYLSSEEVDEILGQHIERMRIQENAKRLHEEGRRIHASTLRLTGREE